MGWFSFSYTAAVQAAFHCFLNVFSLLKLLFTLLSVIFLVCCGEWGGRRVLKSKPVQIFHFSFTEMNECKIVRYLKCTLWWFNVHIHSRKVSLHLVNERIYPLMFTFFEWEHLSSTLPVNFNFTAIVPLNHGHHVFHQIFRPYFIIKVYTLLPTSLISLTTTAP